MAENLRKLEHDYTSAEKDSNMPKWPIISYSTEDEHVNYIGGQKITYWVNVPSAGTYSIFGNRTNGKHYDSTQNYKVKVDGKVVVASSLTYTFNEVGEHKIEVKAKYSDLSLYKFKDEGNSVATVAPITKIDLSHVETVNNTYTMFQNCYALSSVGDISNWCTSACTDMSYMFNYCYALTSVGDLSKWDTSKVTTMTAMFDDCHVLTSIGDLSNWGTSACTEMTWMFNQCHVLTSVGDLSNWDISKVTTMNCMFQDCHSLTSVGDISNWCTSACTAMDYMFGWCYALTSVGDLTNWNTSKVTTMKQLFCYCYKIDNIGIPPIPKGCNTANMFYGCNELKNITASGTISASVSFSGSPLTKESALILFNALDSTNVGTLTLSTSTKALLSEDDIKIATGKGWTVA